MQRGAEVLWETLPQEWTLLGPAGVRADNVGQFTKRFPRTICRFMQRDLIYDVGMHRGEDTDFYLRKGYRVVAIEADPDLVAANRDRFSAEVKNGRLTIVSGAIADPDTDAITFYRHPTESAWGTTDPGRVKRKRNPGIEPVEVPVVDISLTLAEHGTPWYMKIDIEGADRLCLGSLRDLTEPPVYVSIESEKMDWSALVAEFDLLEELGFDRYAAVQQAALEERPVEVTSLSGERFTYRFELGASGVFGEDIQHWASRTEVLAQYRRIFRRYRLLGDHAFINRFGPGFRLRKTVQRAIGKPLPGWYDTHARRSAADEDRVDLFRGERIS
jgi:FkbM family methyltransferase